MKDKIIAYIKAGYPGLFIVSSEDMRVQNMLKEISDEMEYNLFAWNLARFVDINNAKEGKIPDPVAAVQKITEMPEESIYLLEDFHLFLKTPNPKIIRVLKDAFIHGKASQKTIVMLGCQKHIPPELEKLITVIDLDLPDTELLGTIAETLKEGIEGDIEYKADEITQSMRGMTCLEAENALALSYCKTQGFDPDILAAEKVQAIEKSGMLTYYAGQESLSDVGGMDVLKSYIEGLQDAYSQEALDFGLKYPKGILTVGIPGAGKSLTCRTMSNVLGIPLLRLDVGSLFGSLVGQTEENTRAFIKLAEAVAPVVVWIDELEKGFAGTQGSGKTDSGTTARSFATLLSWMQDKTAPVFIAATANNIDQLPPEFLRKGRFDEIFFVDMPTEKEREEIWKIHIKKVGRKLPATKIKELARDTHGYTGAEIEQAVLNGLRRAFHTKGQKLTHPILKDMIKEMIPLSQTMEAKISAMREWAEGRALNASTQRKQTTTRKLAPTKKTPF